MDNSLVFCKICYYLNHKDGYNLARASKALYNKWRTLVLPKTSIKGGFKNRIISFGGIISCIVSSERGIGCNYLDDSGDEVILFRSRSKGMPHLTVLKTWNDREEGILLDELEDEPNYFDTEQPWCWRSKGGITKKDKVTEVRIFGSKYTLPIDQKHKNSLITSQGIYLKERKDDIISPLAPCRYFVAHGEEFMFRCNIPGQMKIREAFDCVLLQGSSGAWLFSVLTRKLKEIKFLICDSNKLLGGLSKSVRIQTSSRAGSRGATVFSNIKSDNNVIVAENIEKPAYGSLVSAVNKRIIIVGDELVLFNPFREFVRKICYEKSAPPIETSKKRYASKHWPVEKTDLIKLMTKEFRLNESQVKNLKSQVALIYNKHIKDNFEEVCNIYRKRFQNGSLEIEDKKRKLS